MQPGKYTKYGVVRNGILLYGRRVVEDVSGRGYSWRVWAAVSACFWLATLISMWMGDTEKRIHAEFEDAARQAPVLLFFDEVDSLVTSRQPLAAGGDPTGFRPVIQQRDYKIYGNDDEIPGRGPVSY